MRKAWAKPFNRRSFRTLNQQVQAEYATRAKFVEDTKGDARWAREQEMVQRIRNLYGNIRNSTILLKMLRDEGSSLDHHICMHRDPTLVVILHFSSDQKHYFFIKTDLMTQKVYKSVRYNSRFRALDVFTRKQIMYREYDLEAEKERAAELREEEAARILEQLNKSRERLKQEEIKIERTIVQAHSAELKILDLNTLPLSMEELKIAFKKACFKHHPDYGGTNERIRKVLSAFEILKRRFN